MRIYIPCLLFSLLCFSEECYAQALYDKQSNVIATKISDKKLNVTGSTFLIEDGRMIEVRNGERREDLGINYASRTNNRTEYFNKEDRLVGYHIPSENRFYHVESISGKANHIALLYERKIYTVDEKPTFTVDRDFPPEWVGYVLFFFLGY